MLFLSLSSMNQSDTVDCRILLPDVLLLRDGSCSDSTEHKTPQSSVESRWDDWFRSCPLLSIPLTSEDSFLEEFIRTLFSRFSDVLLVLLSHLGDRTCDHHRTPIQEAAAAVHSDGDAPHHRSRHAQARGCTERVCGRRGRVCGGDALLFALVHRYDADPIHPYSLQLRALGEQQIPLAL